MKRIDYNEYLDKVYGCWLGKCISGTIGAPFEGMKEQFEYEFHPKAMEKMLPNDDLDLQVLWLDVLERKGINIASEDLAEAFVEKCPYDFGEYAYFKKNYKRGIHPPLSGTYNNRYYSEGMGCAIRSEIWACISPGNPDLALQYAKKDGSLDHGEESVYSEQFLAGLEAEAFFESDIYKLFEKGLTLIPENSKISGCVKDVIEWCSLKHDWRFVRGLIINKYGHPDCTNLFQNIGFTILSLIYGKGHFINTTMLALNCGYDTDCICATSGAILGIIHGANNLIKNYNLEDTGYILGVNITRHSYKIYDLALDTCRVGISVCKTLNTEVEIFNIPTGQIPLISAGNSDTPEIQVEYDGLPAIGLGQRKKVKIYIKNKSRSLLHGRLLLEMPENFEINCKEKDIVVPAEAERIIEVELYVDRNVYILNETNIITARLLDGDKEIAAYKFGIAGAAIWKVYGPFWDNVVEVPHVELGESYFKYICGNDENETADLLRDYHLNATVDIDKEYMPEEKITEYDTMCITDPSKNGITVQTFEDRICFSDLVSIQGPCSLYLIRHLYFNEDKSVCINIGHTDAYKLWINGELISKSEAVTWWTAENKHILGHKLKKGENRIVIKLLRRSKEAEFSLIFGSDGLLSSHLIDLASVNIK